MKLINTNSPFIVNRTVRFGDTDAAGVMHFHRVFSWCHEAYEESLECFGLGLERIFPTSLMIEGYSASWPSVLLPIIHCSADYRLPLVCGDKIRIELAPRVLSVESFDIYYHFISQDNCVMQAKTRHLAIQGDTRKPCCLPVCVHEWASFSKSLDR